MQLLNNVEDWDQFRDFFCIPDSTYEALKKQHPEGAPLKEASCEWYLTNHPAPSWRDVADSLYMCEEHTILDILRTHYLKGQ